MKTVSVNFEVKLPETKNPPSEAEVEDWIKYNLGTLGGLSLENPLAHYDLEAESSSVRVS